MAGLQKNSGITAGLVGPVEIRGDVEAGQTFENYFFDHIALTLDTAVDSGIQRAGVIGQPTDQREQLFTDRSFSALGVGDAADFGNDLLPLLKLLLRDLVHPPQQGILIRLLRAERWEESAAQKRNGRQFHDTILWPTCRDPVDKP